MKLQLENFNQININHFVLLLIKMEIILLNHLKKQISHLEINNNSFQLQFYFKLRNNYLQFKNKNLKKY